MKNVHLSPAGTIVELDPSFQLASATRSPAPAFTLCFLPAFVLAFFFLFCFETGFHVAQVDLELHTQDDLELPILLPLLFSTSFVSAVIMGMYHHAWLSFFFSQSEKS